MRFYFGLSMKYDGKSSFTTDNKKNAIHYGGIQ